MRLLSDRLSFFHPMYLLLNISLKLAFGSNGHVHRHPSRYVLYSFAVVHSVSSRAIFIITYITALMILCVCVCVRMRALKSNFNLNYMDTIEAIHTEDANWLGNLTALARDCNELQGGEEKKNCRIATTRRAVIIGFSTSSYIYM